jgi:hypothetical protein
LGVPVVWQLAVQARGGVRWRSCGALIQGPRLMRREEGRDSPVL